MDVRPSRYLVTAALPYANGPVHIGHLAGVYLPADIYVRYLRAKGEDVKFICGSDEHGVPITIRAQKEGVTPQQVVDKYHAIIKESFQDFGVSFDIYSRTSSPVHHQTASDFFSRLYDEEVFTEQTSEQLFDEQASQFLADRYVVGTCPRCGNENAYGDQCESCGSTLSPSELINPRSALSGATPVLRETKHWYLPLDQYETWLRSWILDSHQEWKPNVYGQCKSWIDQGLQARAVTRDLDWGVPVPLKEATGKVLYVWFDAPIGYISATKELLPDTWQQYWQQKDTKLVHFIGKDNIVFHCIIFPTMLYAHGDYVLPDNVPANEFLNLEGNKISTSRNWAVWLHEYLQELPGKADSLRYSLCANAPETKDNDFTWKDFQARHNNELVAILGNFVNRAVVLTHKYYEGNLPARRENTELETALIDELALVPKLVGEYIENYRFRDALAEVMRVARAGNKYLAETEPWKLIKTNPERVPTILNLSLQLAANLTILLRPFLPATANRLAGMLNAPVDLTWAAAGQPDLLPAGHQLQEAQLLFEKIEDITIDAQLQKLADTKSANQLANAQPEPLKPEITFDDFGKLDLRVGTIIAAEKVAKAKKLLQLTVDTGIEKRTIVSGIAEHFQPENIIGQQVVIVANLAPRELRGITSQGMILMAENADGSLRFVQPSEKVTNGSSVS
jgi:methionyl-tRNA synthetase